MVKEFILEQFDSRNTSFNRTIKRRDFVSACSRAKKLSKHLFYPVIIYSGEGQWVKYERGEKVEYSY